MTSAFNCSAYPSHDPDGDVVYPSSRLEFSLAVYIILVICSLAFPLVFYWGKKVVGYERLRVRRFSTILVSVVGCLIHAHVGPLFLYVGVNNYSCALRSFLSMLIIPALGSAIVVKLLTFFFLNELSRAMFLANQQSKAGDRTSRRVIGSVQVAAEDEDNNNNAGYASSNVDLFDSQKRNLSQRFWRALVDIVTAARIMVTTDSNGRAAMDQKQVIQALVFIAGWKGMVSIFGLILIPFLVAALVLCMSDPSYFAGCTGCALTSTEVYEIAAAGVLCVMWGTVAAFRVRHLPDPWKLRREASLGVLCACVSLVGFCVGAFAPVPATSTFDTQFVIVLGMVAFLYVQTIYQVGVAYRTEGDRVTIHNKFRERRERKREQKNQHRNNHSVVESTPNPPRSTTNKEDEAEAEAGDAVQRTVSPATSTGGPDNASQAKLTLKSIMGNPSLLKCFEEFLVDELGIESLIFLNDTEDWRLAFFDVAPSARLARAKKIYQTYINPSGTFPINIPYSVCNGIKAVVQSGDPAACKESLFDDARDEVMDLLQAGAVTRFQGSVKYHKFADGAVVIASVKV